MSIEARQQHLGRILWLLPTLMLALTGCGSSGAGDASDAATLSVATSRPIISGSPATTVAVNSNYRFQPSSAHPVASSLVFRIQNKPAWAMFSSSTGELAGTPRASNVGHYSNIIISARDGSASAALSAFSIEVTPLPNTAAASTSSSSTKSNGTPSSPSPSSPGVASPASGGNPVSSSSSLTWQTRLSKAPHIFAIDYIQPNQLPAAQGAESIAAKYPLVITGETYGTPNPMTTYLNNVRSLNSNIVLMSYLNPFQDSIPESTGPGYDAMRYLESIESAYLHDTSGNRLYYTDAFGKHAYFDPSSNDVRSAVLAAIRAVLTAYPFDGIFLDNYDVQNLMLLDTQGNQYLGSPGQVLDAADYAAKLSAMTSLSTMIRNAWPTALIIANGSNAFPSFNGETVEGNSHMSRVPTQAAATADRVLPFIPLFIDAPMSGPADPRIATDMAEVQALGAWYGASVTYEVVIWPTAFGPQ